MKVLLLLFFIPWVLLSAHAQDKKIASTVVVNGTSYGLHSVLKGETLYSISKNYSLQVRDLIVVNRLDSLQPTIRPGDMLIIPLSSSITPAPKPVTQAPKPDPKPLSVAHEVKPGDTWFSIARLYGISFSELKTLNPGRSDTLKIGDQLKVKVVIDDKAMFYPKPAAPPVESPKSNASALFPKESVNVQAQLQTQFDQQMKGKKESRFRGLATWLHTESDPESRDQFLGLHRDLPVGTIVKVKNLMNQKTVYVKIIGRIPEGSSNKDYLLKISEDAARQLDVLDQNFLVEVSAAGKE